MRQELQIVVTVTRNNIRLDIPEQLRLIPHGTFDPVRQLQFPDNDYETFESDDQVYHDVCNAVASFMEANHLDYKVRVTTTFLNGFIREERVNYHGEYEVE